MINRRRKYIAAGMMLVMAVAAGFSPFSISAAMAQDFNLGTPPVRNYDKKTYRAGTQTWEITQAPDGRMYLANNDGMLEFDGVHWRLFPISNRTVVRSVGIAADGKIYAGAQGEMGYFLPDKSGILTYHSVKHLVPDEQRNFEDVWDILIRPEGVYFRTNHQLFFLHEGKMDVLLSNQPLIFSGIFQDKVLVQNGALNLMILENGRFIPFVFPGNTAEFELSAIIPVSPDTVLFTTIRHGIYYSANNRFGKWTTPHDNLLQLNRIYCAALLPDGKIALGSSLNGLVIMDRHRRILQQINKETNLQNNTVLSLFSDKNGGLWAGLDNGIDFINIKSAFTAVSPDGKKEGTGYVAAIHQGKIYFGTNTGVYFTDWKDYYLPSEAGNFRQVKNASGQVWGLQSAGGDLLGSFHEGPFLIKDGQAIQMADIPGVWKFQPISDRYMLAGSYQGLSLFAKKTGQWELEATLGGFSESSRIIAKDEEGQIWVSHPYRGIYKIQIDTVHKTLQAEFFNSANGLPSDLNNYVYNLNGKAFFATEKGIYHFNKAANRFEQNEKFNAIFGQNQQVKYLRQDQAGNIWYVTGHDTGVLRVEDRALEKSVQRMSIPDLSDKLVGGFEFIFPVDDKNVFFATEQGFIHFNPSIYQAASSSISIVLHSVHLVHQKDSLIYGGHVSGEGVTEMPHYLNAIRFDFSGIDYAGSDYVAYTYFLEGLDDEWSGWDKRNSLVFNNLSPGSYTLHLKARNKTGAESTPLTWSFRIRPPWYGSPVARAFYALFIAALIGALYFSQRRHFEKEKAFLQTSHRQKEALHQQQAEQSEAVIARLKNEKLQTEVQYKNQELATATMHLVQKSELMTTIRQALEKLLVKTENKPALNTEISRLIKVIENDTRLHEDWNHFSKYFDEVHSDFLKRLGEQFPQLSPNDFKLCAFLRMNLSSKEIASLMNISVRGVEASRYRLRKRLGIETDTNLTEFLMRL